MVSIVRLRQVPTTTLVLGLLLDTGAGLSFISEDIVEQLKLPTKTVPAINIRLGNGSTESVNEVVTTEVHINNIPIPITAYKMPLPAVSCCHLPRRAGRAAAE